jgi:geranylgeranyl pyrophosphate synthase
MADMVHYHMDCGGKRLRPVIVLQAVDALGGNSSAALPFAAGLELLHNATLVHDDYQDGDTVRRGEPTVWVKYGFAQSINAGDALYFLGMRLLADSKIDDADIKRLTTLTSTRLLQVIEGQVNEFRLKRERRPNEQHYIDVIRGKTAGLFSLPLEGAGICAGCSDLEVSRLASAGDTLGLLFQVQDDLLDLIGNKGRDQVGTDLAEGKPSLPVVYALAHGNSDLAGELKAIVKKRREATSSDDIQRGIDLLEQAGAIEYSLDRIRAWQKDIKSDHAGIQQLLDDMTDAILAPISHRL